MAIDPVEAGPQSRRLMKSWARHMPCAQLSAALRRKSFLRLSQLTGRGVGRYFDHNDVHRTWPVALGASLLKEEKMSRLRNRALHLALLLALAIAFTLAAFPARAS